MEENKGLLSGLISFVINFVLTIFFVNTIGIIVSAIYMALDKKRGKYTVKLYSLLSFALFTLQGFVKNPVEADMTKYVSVEIISGLMMVGVSLVIYMITKKIAHR